MNHGETECLNLIYSCCQFFEPFSQSQQALSQLGIALGTSAPEVKIGLVFLIRYCANGNLGTDYTLHFQILEGKWVFVL